jgi:phage terminase large subunit GpA-like protein
MIDRHEQRCWAGIRRHYREIFAEEPDQMVFKWCEQNIYLSEMESEDHPGLLDTDLTPWIREPLECLRDDEVKEITIIAGTQVIKTLFMICAIAWWAKHRGTRMLFVMDTVTNAGDFCETRLQPIFENSPALSKLIPVDRKTKWNKLRMYIGRALLNLTGSNSAGNLASRPAPFVAMDEVGKFKAATAKETDAVSLTKDRTKGKSRVKILITSSATVEYGLEWLAYLRGSQEVFEVQCPHCGEFIELLIEHIRWCPLAKRGGRWNMDLVHDTAHYVCQRCHGHIGSHQKRAVNRKNRWRAQNQSAPRSIRTFRIPSYYSPWESCSFGNVAVEYLTCLKENNLKKFLNGMAALPDTANVDKLDWEILKARREKYAQTYPERTAYVTIFIDVQKGWFELFAYAWGPNDEHWLVEHEIINADPSIETDWDELNAYIDKERPIPMGWATVDYGGHWHANAIAWVRKTARQNIRLAFGSKDDQLIPKGRRTKTKSRPKTPLFEYGVSQAKDTLAKWLTIDKPGRSYCHFPDWIDDEFFRQRCAEEKRPHTVQGKTVYRWQNVRDNGAGRNEAVDGHVGAYCGKLQIPLATRKRWQVEAKERLKKQHADAVVEKPISKTGGEETAEEKPKQPPRGSRRPARKSRGWVNG